MKKALTLKNRDEWHGWLSENHNKKFGQAR